jgi:hypothetical protein
MTPNEKPINNEQGSRELANYLKNVSSEIESHLHFSWPIITDTQFYSGSTILSNSVSKLKGPVKASYLSLSGK